MTTEEYKKRIQASKDKVRLLSNFELLSEVQLSNDAKEYFETIREELKDEEIFELLHQPIFQSKEAAFFTKNIINLISVQDVLSQILYDESIISQFEPFQLIEWITKLDDDNKMQMLHNSSYLSDHTIGSYYIRKIINSMHIEQRIELLQDKSLFIDELKLSQYDYFNLIVSCLPNENDKCVEFKKQILLHDEETTNKHDKTRVLSSFETNDLVDFFNSNGQFLIAQDIHLRDLLIFMDIDAQLDLVKTLDSIDIPMNEKRLFLALLKPEAKQQIDTTDWPDEYKTALSMKTDDKLGIHIIIDFEKPPENYVGLDKVLLVNPQGYTKEQRDYLFKLCQVCPNMEIECNLGFVGISSVSEYLEGEKWIEELISSINPNWSPAQKIAYVDHVFGKKLSYSPDFESEIFNEDKARALWKILVTGYGVCNGIANAEKYVLDRIGGINCELISSGNHAFLKIIDIEVPLVDGTSVRGNTILDPTWNLYAQRFGACPQNFFVSYEEIRKHDITDDGIDRHCHKNDEQLQDATLNLDINSLRALYASIGLTNECGLFPVVSLIDAVEQINKDFPNQPEQNIQERLNLIVQVCPEFATCQNSSRIMLQGLLSLKIDALKLRKDAIIDRVYRKSDEDKKTTFFLYVDSSEFGSFFYVPDESGKQFQKLTPIEFINQFECYQADIDKNNGLRPWETQHNNEPKRQMPQNQVAHERIEGDER